MVKNLFRSFFGVCLAVSFVAIPVMLFAQDAPAEAPVQATSMFNIIVSGGGAIGIVIILLSVVSMTLIIENMISLNRDKLIPPGALSTLEGMFDDEDYEGALQLCEAEDSPLTNTLSPALARMDGGYEAMLDGLIESGDEQATYLGQKISYLSLIAGVSPMLGLFGTVWGMIRAFDKISKTGGAAKPDELAEGIMLALVTTFLGLFVAIPTSAFYFFLRNRVSRIVIEINAVCSELLERFRE